MFADLNLQELRMLIRELRDHHSIKNYGKMKKAQLIAELSAKFVLRDGNLYLKEDTRAPKEAKAKTAKPYAKAKTAAQLMAEYDGIEKKDYAAIKKELTEDLKGFAGDPLTKLYPILMKFGYEV